MNPTKRKLAIAVLVLAGTWPLAAQTAAPTAAPTAASSEEEQVVKLSPFEVSTTRNVGYQATDTLAGTRIRTDLKDVGASISVLTQEFLNDIGATDNGTLLQYTTNAEVAGTRGVYAGLGNGSSVDESGNLRSPGTANRVRGLAPLDNARDFYITDIPWDSFNVDRVEILRGPNSILYGLGSPAGIINGSTRGAEFNNRVEVTARTGSYGSARATLDLNQQLIDNVLAIRVDGMWNDEKYEQQPAFQNDKRIYGALRFDPQLFRDRSFHTSIKLKLEHGEINANRPRIIPPNDAITPWWRPVAVSASNPFGGAGKVLVNNPYDPWRTDGVVVGDRTSTATGSRGLTQQSTPNFVPYLSDLPNQQQPYWLIDGTTNQLYAVNGGYINNGARNSSGAFTGISSGLVNKRTNGMFYGLANLPAVVTSYNNASDPNFLSANNPNYAAGLRTFPGAQFGQYRNMSLQDPSVFDFYHTLIDGPTKNEFEKWTAYNLDFTQTGWDDRVGVELTYDRQKYKNGAQQLLGGSPTLTLDVMKNFLDYYTPAGSPNANVGRPYVQGATNNGGRSYYSDREYRRASLFGELRPSDYFKSDFLTKLLGKQRFNVVGADEKYFNENRTWQLYANSQQWAGYWNGNTGASSSIADRAPQAMIYLGSSVTNLASPSGAHIPGITAPVALQDHGVYVFDTTWTNPTGVNYADAWNVPANLYTVFNGLPNPESTTQLTQASNPANYLGWNSNFQDQLLRYNDGQDNSLLTLAQKQLRETISYASSYQGYFWNNALVATLGWRYDAVKTKGVNASNQSLNRNILNLQPSVYRLPDGYPHSAIVKGHSTSGGAVLHLNSILPRDPLPINVSLGYNESSNFQVTSQRVDIYGNPLQNPTGKTYEYSILLSTKDGKYSLKAVQYKNIAKNASSGLSDPGGVGRIIQQGLRWRNVLLYQLGGYDWASRNAPQGRNNWTNAYPTDTNWLADENSAITTWNNIQKTLAAKGFFKAWNFTPTGPDSALVDYSTFQSNPTQYAPDPATVSAYSALPSGPQGFTVTADTMAKGDEFEFVANPTPNWRIEFTASKSTAVRNNVGGPVLDAYVAYIDSQLINSDGTLKPAGMIAQFGNPAFALYPNVWAPWKANYTLMKLQEGSAAPELRKWRYTVVTNYTFDRWFLKGVGVGGAYRWVDKVVIGYPVATSGTFDLTQPYYGPSEAGTDLWFSYARKIGSKVNWKIQLNVRNAFAKHGLIPISIEPDGHTWASVRVKPIQEWFVTNTFSF